MKLSYVLLLSLAAVVAADSYEHYQNSYPEDGQNSYPEEGQSPSNYYTRRQGHPSRRAGFAERVKRFFGFGATRRQFAGTGTGTGFTGAGTGGGQFVGQQAGFAAAPAAGGGLGGLPLALLFGLMALVGLAALAGAIYLATQLNNSGRGLDTDDWEVDHSVWMDQLQKDFEDSWSTEN